jgi:hypothetical protein
MMFGRNRLWAGRRGCAPYRAEPDEQLRQPENRRAVIHSWVTSPHLDDDHWREAIRPAGHKTFGVQALGNL